MFYALIFIAKLTEVAITTVRIVLTTRGNRIAASLLAAVEIAIWLAVAGTVLLGKRRPSAGCRIRSCICSGDISGYPP